MALRLHPKYGVNPTVSTCIVCGGDKNEVILLGAAYKEEAPMRMIFSVEPCEECKEKYLKEGVLLVEADEERKPTGSVIVLTEEAFRRIFNVSVPEKRICFAEIGVFSKIGVGDALNEQKGGQSG